MRERPTHPVKPAVRKTTLAVDVVVLSPQADTLAVLLVRLGLSGRIERHRRLAVIAWPIWLYVSITGVVIYAMLYVVNPPPS